MGSPDFALPSLQVLSEKFPVIGVITQPDKPAGRGKVITPPPVKELANKLGLEVFQPVTLRDQATERLLRSLKPDVIVVVAYGKILPANILVIPKFGCINVHASLLPRWRGASPIQAAILAGDSETGVTIMKLGVGLDDGPILAQESSPIFPDDTAGSLSERLAKEGAVLLTRVLPRYIDGSISPIPQDASRTTMAPKIKKEDGLLDFSLGSYELSLKIRAFSPWPLAYFMMENLPVRVFKAQPKNESSLKPGQRGRVDGFPAIGTAHGDLLILALQLPGKKKVAGKDFLRGARNWDT